jgi:hypothetical protein
LIKNLTDISLLELFRKTGNFPAVTEETLLRSFPGITGLFRKFWSLKAKRLLITCSLCLTIVYHAVAPSSNSITVIELPPIQPYKALMNAIGLFETKGNTLAYNEKENAVGIFQIRQVRIDDYNRRTGNNYALTDMFDKTLSEKVFLYFASRYKPCELEKIAKAWNGSGPKTEYYWKRIKEKL